MGRSGQGRRSYAISLALTSAVLFCVSAAPAAAAPLIAAAGDIDCNSATPGTDTCHAQATADLLSPARDSAVLVLGDAQYEAGTLDEFQRFYDRTWGKVKAITHPALGYHEYSTTGAAGYFSYFGKAAGPVGQGYYSFDVGSWHLIALNTNCAYINCAPGSLQERWLKADLAAHPATCTLAYSSHPRFSSGPQGSEGAISGLWNDLYAGGAELLLSGHNHLYERFAPQSPSAKVDSAHGIRQFVVGTGGRSHHQIVGGVLPNSEVQNSDTFGILELTLEPTSYTWRFVPEAGGTFTDAGSGICHGPPGVPLLKLSGPLRLRGHTLRGLGQCISACTVEARASVTIGKRRKQIKSTLLKLGLATGDPRRLVFGLSRRSARKIRRALTRHRKVRAVITAVAKDPAGNTSNARLRKRVRPGRA